MPSSFHVRPNNETLVSPRSKTTTTMVLEGGGGGGGGGSEKTNSQSSVVVVEQPTNNTRVLLHKRAILLALLLVQVMYLLINLMSNGGRPTTSASMSLSTTTSRTTTTSTSSTSSVQVVPTQSSSFLLTKLQTENEELMKRVNLLEGELQSLQQGSRKYSSEEEETLKMMNNNNNENENKESKSSSHHETHDLVPSVPVVNVDHDDQQQPPLTAAAVVTTKTILSSAAAARTTGTTMEENKNRTTEENNGVVHQVVTAAVPSTSSSSSTPTVATTTTTDGDVDVVVMNNNQLFYSRNITTPPLSGVMNNHSWYPSEEWFQNCTKDMEPLSEELGEFYVVEDIALGDCIKLCHCYNSPNNATFNQIYHNLACKNRKRVDDEGNLTVVEQVHTIQEQIYSRLNTSYLMKPEDDALVIHLRLGDVVETSPATVEQMLVHGGDPGHKKRHFPKALKSARELLDNIRQANVTKVRIVGGSHKSHFYKKSRVYSSCIYKAIQAAGYDDVTMHVEGYHPDQDFYYISHAKQLVVSAGGYSNLMGKIAVRRGGTIIGRKFSIHWRRR